MPTDRVAIMGPTSNVLYTNSKTGNLLKLYRKVKHNEKIYLVHDLLLHIRAVVFVLC